MRIVVFSTMTIFAVWMLLDQAGADYSAGAQTRHTAAVCRTLKLAPHERHASLLSKLFRALIF